MPRTEEQYEAIRKKSKTVIMETALELFAEKGFHNTSISQIAKVAGVSKGLMYNYFESKEALLDAIIFGVVEESSGFFEESLFAAIPPKERLKLIIDGAFMMVQNNFKHWKLLTMLAFQSRVYETFKIKLDKQKTESLEKFIQLFEIIGVEHPKLEALMVASVLDGALMQYMYLEADYPLEEMKEHIIKRFCS